MYIAWIRIDETLPWIELQGEYPTRRAARKAATAYLKSAQVEILELPEKRVAAKPTAQVVIASR